VEQTAEQVTPVHLGQMILSHTAEAIRVLRTPVRAPQANAHRALGQVPPLGPGESAVVLPTGPIVRRDRLGGLIHEYAQVA
jgi:hypothetical protein